MKIKKVKKWKKQTFVIQTDSEYNNQICFQLFGEEKITILESHKEGDKIEVFLIFHLKNITSDTIIMLMHGGSIQSTIMKKKIN